MTKEVKLEIEESVFQHVKKYAEEKGLSLSEMVEVLFRDILKNHKSEDTSGLSPKVQALRGIISSDTEINAKEVVAEELAKKYEA
jgi:hypothetical protein